jgi:hypothetical protein
VAQILVHRDPGFQAQRELSRQDPHHRIVTAGDGGRVASSPPHNGRCLDQLAKLLSS